MCLIVVKDAPDAVFTVENFKHSFGRNSDGTGIMYVEDGRVKVERTMGSEKLHVELYMKHKHRDQFVLHQRFGTHGEKTLRNVHPFKVMCIDDGDPYDLYMVHNGVINQSHFWTSSDPKEKALIDKCSDTNLFVQQYMRPLLSLAPDMIEHPAFLAMVDEFVGGYNKLTFLRNDGTITIINKQAGDMVEGCWLSNKGAIAAPYVPPARSTHNYQQNQTATYPRMARKNHGEASYYGGYTGEGPWHADWYEANETAGQSNLPLLSNSAMAAVAKEKEGLISALDMDTLVQEVDSWDKLTEKELEKKVIEDSSIVVDALWLLQDGDLDRVQAMKEPAPVLAARMFKLLEGYKQVKAA